MAVLTPDTARELLRLPEKDQERLVLKPRTLSQEVMQARILQHLHDSGDEHGAQEGHPGEHEHEHPDSALQMETPHHTVTPAQEKAERQWALIFVTAIVTASVTFETLKEITEENTPPTMIKVVEKFFAELATLGFIGTIAFVMVSRCMYESCMLDEPDDTHSLSRLHHHPRVCVCVCVCFLASVHVFASLYVFLRVDVFVCVYNINPYVIELYVCTAVFVGTCGVCIHA